MLAALRSNPRNSVAWVDLSLEYATLGLKKQATRAMRVAVDLAPNHRFTLRSAARLFVHLGDPEYAHRLLVESQTTASDPWLMAAEIAVAAVADASSEFLKDGRQLIKSGEFSPWHLSELAAAVGTVELEHGNHRIGKKLFREALVHPTDNTVGQARWVEHAASIELLDDAVLRTRGAFEARAWQHYYAGLWKDAVEEAECWLADEPYSSRPAALGSCIAGAVLEQYDRAVMIARMGVRANPEDVMLLNNLAFSLINCGELDEAEHVLTPLEAAALDPGQTVVIKATSGLLRFRRSDAGRGRQLYLEANGHRRKA